MYINHYFPTMTNHPTWVGVAFKTGTMTSAKDIIVMGATLGPYVHCELIFGTGMQSNVFASYDDTQKNSGFMRSLNTFNDQEWLVLTSPVSDLKTAQIMSLQLLDLEIPYNHNDLWQCCIKAVLPFEDDLDCDLLHTWKHTGVFCSQMCLLFLRHFARTGVLDANDTLKHHLEYVHSRGCSPNMLYEILKNHFVSIKNT